MSDLFSLAPEGQVWADAQAASNPAQPDDYNPRWYAGSGSAVFRGAAEGGIGLLQTGVEAAKLTPTYSALRGDIPDLDQVVDQNFSDIQKSLNDARNTVKPGPNSQGIAADVLEGLGRFAPAMGATVAAGPVAGGAVAFGSSFESTRQDFLAKGVDADTAGTLALGQATSDALGMALPAGVGMRITTRVLSGIGINTGFGAANRFALGDTLEENGYDNLAKQYRVWDKQALLVDGVLGAAFGAVGARGLPNLKTARMSPEDIRSTFGENYVSSPDGSTETLIRDLADAGLINLFRQSPDENGNQRGGYVEFSTANRGDATLNINIEGRKSHQDLLDNLHHEALHFEQANYPEWKAKKLVNAVLNSSAPEFDYAMSRRADRAENGTLREQPDGYNYLNDEEIAAHAVEPSHAEPVNTWGGLVAKFKAGVFRSTGLQLGKVTPEQLRSIVRMRLDGMSMDAAIEREMGNVVTGSGFPKNYNTPNQRDDITNIGEVTSPGLDTSEPASPTVPQADAGQPAVTYESRIAELQDLAGQVMNRGDRKALAQEVHDLQYQLDQASSQMQELKNTPLTGSGKALSQARAQRTSQVNDLDLRMGLLKEQIDQRGTTLADSSPGGRFYDARSDLSRLDQGIIPESMRGLVPETGIRPSDVDAAHVLNEGLHYDIESSPVVHGNEASINSHVAAMDQASRQLMDGEPVNVSEQIRGLDGIVRPDAIAAGEAQRASIEEMYRENGIPETVREVTTPEAPQVRNGSAFSGGRQSEAATPEQISTNPDTGEALSSNSFDLMAARDMSQAKPDIMVAHPDTGEQVSLAQALADLDNQIATAQKESDVYSVAANCFLRNP